MDDINDKHVKYNEEPTQQDVVPQDPSHQDVVPQAPSLQEVVPQEFPLQDVIPQESSHQHVISQKSSLKDMVAQETSLQGVIPQVPSVKDVTLPLPEIRGSRITLQEQRLEDKRRRVQEARLRLKIQEQKLNEVLLPKEAHSQQEFSQDDKSSTIISLSTSTPSDASLKANEYVAEEDLFEKMTMIELVSSSSDDLSEKGSDRGSIDTDDPMQTKVHDLMLVPSLSDFSLSDVPVLNPEVSMKSLTTPEYSKGNEGEGESESESLESKSVGSIESRSSFPKMDIEFERVDDRTEIVRESLEYPEAYEVQFEERTLRGDSTNFEDFATKSHGVFRGSSIVQENQLMQDNKKMISNFVDMLINRVIRGDDPNAGRRNNLDKNKLHAGIQECLKEYVKVLGFNDSLNQMMGEHFHINKNFRVFADLGEEDGLSYLKRYKSALSSVALAEEKLIAVKEKASKLSLMAQMEINHVTHTALGTEQHLEQAVRRLLIRPESASDQLRRWIEHELRWMNEHRTEISYKRYLLIALQHDLATLKERIRKLDTMDNQVCMQDFLTLQAKTQHFEQKIEERNGELKKMRTQYRKELYQVHNNREKILALKDRLFFWSDHLDTICEKRDGLKNQLLKEKMQHIRIRAKNNELAFQGGILSMPSLMSDYDATMSFIQQKQESIAGLKETVKTLTLRLSNLQAKDAAFS